jgi:hypothetical protein
MKLQGYDNGGVETKEFSGPYSVYQSEFKGRKIDVKVIRLRTPQKFDEHLSVNVLRIPPL